MGRKSIFPGRVVSAPTSFRNTMPPKRAIFQSARISLSGRSFPIATTTAVHNAVRLSSHGTQSPFHASTKLSIARFRRLFCFHLRSHIFSYKETRGCKNVPFTNMPGLTGISQETVMPRHSRPVCRGFGLLGMH